MSSFDVPILLLVFNRPDLTKIVFEKIKLIQPKKLYVAADGPRIDKINENKICDEVKNIVTNVTWDCQLITLFRQDNLGCGHAVSDAINWFFEHEEFGIILEDDCNPNVSFFKFQQELLEKYRHDDSVGLIAGTNLLPELTKDFKESYFFSKYPHIWGWGSWRRVWIKYDFKFNGLNDFLISNQFLRLSSNERNFWRKNFNDVYSGKVNTWDAQVSYLFFKNEFKAIFPVKNLIENIGFREDATHTKENLKFYDSQIEELTFPLLHPNSTRVNLDLDEIRRKREYFYISIWKRILNKISKRILNGRSI